MHAHHDTNVEPGRPLPNQEPRTFNPFEHGTPTGMTSPTAPSSGASDWREKAACRDKPARWFTDPADADDTRRALATCTDCPVRAPCLDLALTHSIEADVGIWGGTTEHTRRGIRDGQLSAPEALQERDMAQLQAPTSPPAQAATRRHDGSGKPSAPTTPLRSPVPELTVARDVHGDYTDVTGRVIIFRIHRDPPWMVLVDGHPIARTDTLTHGRRIAWAALNDPARKIDRHPQARTAGRVSSR